MRGMFQSGVQLYCKAGRVWSTSSTSSQQQQQQQQQQEKAWQWLLCSSDLACIANWISGVIAALINSGGTREPDIAPAAAAECFTAKTHCGASPRRCAAGVLRTRRLGSRHLRTARCVWSSTLTQLQAFCDQRLHVCWTAASMCTCTKTCCWSL